MSDQTNTPEPAQSEAKPTNPSPTPESSPREEQERMPAAEPSEDRPVKADRQEDSKTVNGDSATPAEVKPGGQEDSGDSSKGNSKDLADKNDARHSKNGSRRRRSRGSAPGPNPPPKSSGSHDADKVAKYAWKIYLAEIAEEGVTMVDDRTAKELARRCFELAVTFLDEQTKRNQ